MYVRFYGIRGLTPVPGEHTSKYGGNTSCVAVTFSKKNTIVILDAGTGLSKLGHDIINSKKTFDIHLFISHSHFDHVQGFSMFLPLFVEKYTINVYTPQVQNFSFEDYLTGLMRQRISPVNFGDIKANLKFHSIQEVPTRIDDIMVEARKVNHPVTCYGYRINRQKKSVSYISDHEPYFHPFSREVLGADYSVEKMDKSYRDFIRGSNLFIGDAQYLPSEYPLHRGWGHGTINYVINQAESSRVEKVALFHLDPNRSDKQQEKIYKHYHNLVINKNFKLQLLNIKEGDEVKIV